MSSTAWILCKLWTPLLKSVTEEAFHRIQEKFHFLSGNIEARDGPLEKWLGGGGGELSACTNFFFAPCFFAPCLCFAPCLFFCRWNPLYESFFQRNIAFLLNSEILIRYLCFCTLQIIILHSQQIKGYSPLSNAKSFPKCTHFLHTVRKEEATSGWTASLCIVAVFSLWNSSPQSIIMIPRVKEILQRIIGPSWECLKRDQWGFQYLWGFSWAVQEEIWQ